MDTEIKVPPALAKIAELSQFDIYITGGYIRNIIAGLGETDIDICGPIVPTALNLPKNYIIKVVNYRLGTAVIKNGADEYEYTPFRTESYPSGGAHAPSAVQFTSDLKQDALRRDFACNSIYYNVKTGKLIDPYGGKADAENKILRCRDPEKIFSDDGLRLLRLVRIAAETGFKIEAATASAASKFAPLLSDISPERKRQELDRILSADQKYGVANAHYRGLKLMHQFGLLRYVIPQLELGDKMPQPEKYHKYDVLEHAFRAVLYADPLVRLAALLHDVGKPYCQKKYGNTHGHEKASEYMSKIILENLRYSNTEIDEVSRLCLYHMYDFTGNTGFGKMRLFIAKNYDIIDRLILLIAADRKASGMPELQNVPSRLAAFRDEMIAEQVPIKQSDLKINGGDLLALGIRGEQIGVILRDIHEKCIMEPHLNNRSWQIEYAKRHSGAAV